MIQGFGVSLVCGTADLWHRRESQFIPQFGLPNRQTRWKDIQKWGSGIDDEETPVTLTLLIGLDNLMGEYDPGKMTSTSFYSPNCGMQIATRRFSS